MIAKQHISPEGDLIVAACDTNLLGKVFEEHDLQLSVSKNFFSGEAITDQQLHTLLTKCSNANLVGEKTIAAAIALGMVREQNVKTIAGIPYAYVVKMK